MLSPRSPNTALTLILPGLIWPPQALADMTQGLSLPALSRLLGAGHLARTEGLSIADSLARHLGAPELRPGATLRRKSLALDAGAEAHERWLCLDPIHLGFAERRLLVESPEDLKLTQDEAAQLVSSLQLCFSGLGEIEVTTAQQWHARLAPGVVPPQTDSLAEMIGKRADTLLAGLPPLWKQALNDAQIELHAHPVNQAREAAGRPTVNSLWPWGGEPCDVSPQSPPHATIPSPPASMLLANSIELRAMGIHLGLACQPVPEGWDNYSSGMEQTVAVLDSLAIPARRADANGWREALLHLEQQWFAPILASLTGGTLRHLRIDFIDEKHGHSLTCTRGDLWLDRLAFWRTPVSIRSLAAGDA